MINSDDAIKSLVLTTAQWQAKNANTIAAIGKLIHNSSLPK